MAHNRKCFSGAGGETDRKAQRAIQAEQTAENTPSYERKSRPSLRKREKRHAFNLSSWWCLLNQRP